MVVIWKSTNHDVYIGKKAIISAGELFPNSKRECTREQIEADSEYCSQYKESYQQHTKFHSMNYQLWQVAKALGDDFIQSFWARSYWNPEIGIDFTLKCVDGKWGEWDKHYEIEAVQIGLVKDLGIDTVEGLNPEQEIYRIFAQPRSTYPVAFEGFPWVTPELLETKTRELYQRFVDPSKNIVSRVLVEEQ